MTRTVAILRGLPGSGKSTLAAWLRSMTECADRTAAIVSADHYMTNLFGQYDFDPSRLDHCHICCFERFQQFVMQNVDLIIVDNTNLMKSWYAKYIAFARAENYAVIELTLPFLPNLEDHVRRSTHGASLETIQKMAEKFER